jgi:RNA polymerase subunit RPABC4/transcription elongation factor Spt4
MKYKCQVCGQIIDNNEMCPFCGSDGSQIVPLDGQVKKGHYRCLVCGRETDNGDFCPYCGSQRLYNLDTQKKEDTQSVPILDDNSASEETKTLNPNEEVQEELHEVSEEIEESENESLEDKYFKMFGELLPLESITNPDPEKVNTLYRIGINRGEKITPLEIAKTFEELKEDEVVETKPTLATFGVNEEKVHEEEPKEEKVEVKVEPKVEEEKPVTKPLETHKEMTFVAKPVENVAVIKENKANSLSEVLVNVDLLLANDPDEITSTILMDLRDELINSAKKEDAKTKEDLLNNLEALLKEKKSLKLEKDLELLKVLFK